MNHIDTPLRRISPLILREAALVRKRAEHPETWTFADSTELLRLQRAAQLRAEADQAAERHSEARTFQKAHPNPHGE